MKACSTAIPGLARCPALQSIRLDTDTIGRDRLNIEAKVRSNLFPWNGQFTPQLVDAFLETYAHSGAFVLDPFMGSGTVLVEAGGMGLRAFGSEINPAACQMAETYKFVNVPKRDRRRVLNGIGQTLDHAFGCAPLFGQCGPGASGGDAKSKLVRLWQDETAPQTRQLLGTLIVLSDFYRVGLTPEKVLEKWQRLQDTVDRLPFSESVLDMVNCDARSLPLKANTVDLVITSPPYINVFNYHQQYRASVESMGWNLLHVARSEVGSNRKHRQNRFLTVIQYCLDMADVLRELTRVCQPSARIIVVVGRESNVLRTRFFNAEIVSRLGIRCAGFTAEKRQERVFKNKFGTMIYEDILHFRPRTTGLEAPVTVAEEVLRAALEYAPPESVPDLKDALYRIDEVRPSPLYRHLDPGNDRHAKETADTAS